ncbi:hypothetical protein [Pseudonocardia zijingensis]|uniref:Uncharacterized protein n=1 Tax=Pseudonocardia zijingensis TaxID=153376 RepID=A0ABN1NLA2_9PSEU
MARRVVSDRGSLVSLAALGSLFGHYGGDYLVQDDCMAAHKQQRTRCGRRELVLHAGTYAATQAVTKAVFYQVAGLRVPLLAQLAGAAVEGVLHAVIDDGRLLKRFSRIGAGRARFTDEQGRPLGRQERFHDLAAAGVNGRMLMDQAIHHQVQIPAGVLVTVAVATLISRKAGR